MINVRLCWGEPQPAKGPKAARFLALRRILVLESELQALVAFSLPRCDISLVVGFLINRHAFPNTLLSLVQQHQPPTLREHRHQRERTDRDQNFVTTVVVGRVVCSIYLRPDYRADLHDHVVSRSSQGTFLDIERILRYPRRDDGVEVWV